MPETGYAYITLYFDNITMTGIDQVFYVDLVHIDTGSGVNVNITPATITLEAIGKLRHGRSHT